MRCAARAGLLLFLAGSLSLWAQDPASRKALKIPLTKTSVKKGALRLGFGLQGEIPVTAYQGKVGGESILFFDLNGDDMISPGTDGMAMSYGPFVVPIPEALLLKTGQFGLAFESTKTLLLTPEDLGVFQSYAADASILTELRVRSGRRPAALDPKACAACEKHCEYMKMNGLADGSGGLAGHTEDPAKKGYTAEGAAAGAGGNLAPGISDLHSAMYSWYATCWHGSPMVEPSLTRFGVGLKYGVGVLYFSGRGGTGGLVANPPDGAINIPRIFSFGERGENPNPVPGTDNGRGCGFPIFVSGAGSLASAEVLDGSGRPVAGTISSPSKPANPMWPTNSGCAVFMPSKPLAPMTTYKVTFKFGPGQEPLVWSFTTGK